MRKKLLLAGVAAALLMAQAPHAGVIVLQDQLGGFLPIYKRLFEVLEASGNNIEIRGKCISGCTLVLAYIPKERLCFHETALLGFHHAWSFYGTVTETSQAMFDSYPQDVRTWLQQKGGLEKMPHGAGFWPMSALNYGRSAIGNVRERCHEQPCIYVEWISLPPRVSARSRASACGPHGA